MLSISNVVDLIVAMIRCSSPRWSFYFDSMLVLYNKEKESKRESRIIICDVTDFRQFKQVIV